MPKAWVNLFLSELSDLYQHLCRADGFHEHQDFAYRPILSPVSLPSSRYSLMLNNCDEIDKLMRRGVTCAFKNKGQFFTTASPGSWLRLLCVSCCVLVLPPGSITETSTRMTQITCAALFSCRAAVQHCRLCASSTVLTFFYSHLYGAS